MAPLAAWRDPPLLFYRAANLLLKSALGLHRLGLLPRSGLPPVLGWAGWLRSRGDAELRRLRRAVWRA
jgi:hypothetical protein